MVHQLAHSHPFYKADNATVYDLLVIATLGSQYASNIYPLKGANNGREAINELKAHITGAAHWYREVKVQMEFLLNGTWNVHTAITLHTFLVKHRASVGKKLAGYKRGLPLPVLPMSRYRLPRGLPTHGVPRGGVKSQ